MRRLRSLMAVAALIPVWASAETGPTRVRQSGDLKSPTQSVAYSAPIRVRPIVERYGPPDYVATPEIISRVGEILGAIDNPQKRNQLAEQWLQYSKQVIAKDLEYRQQWLDLQREQLSQQQEVEQLRLEVAKLQVQIEELRARNAQLERENVQAQARLGQGSAVPSAAIR